MIIKISKRVSLYVMGVLVLFVKLQAIDKVDQANPASNASISNAPAWIGSKLHIPEAWQATKEELAAAYNKAHDTLAPYLQEAENLAEKQVEQSVDNIVGYPAFVGEAARAEYLKDNTEKLKYASSEEKHKVIDTADTIATIGRLLSTGSALVAAAVPSALSGEWESMASSLLKTMSKRSLGLILSPILVAASYYLGSTAYQEYLRLVNTYTDVLDKVAEGSLTQLEAQEAQAQMLAAVQVLEAESKNRKTVDQL